MKIRSFNEMVVEYEGTERFDSDDQEQRNEKLSKYNYSIITEGDFLEFDNLDKWIEANIGKGSVENLFYGKIDYDYGFSEFFFNEETYLEKLATAIPNIYTTYPNGRICKNDGVRITVEYDSVNKDEAIVFN